MINSNWLKASYKFWLLVCFLSVVFFTGGSARSDVMSLAILRPMAIAVCGIAIWTTKLDQIRSHAPLISILVGVFVLVAVSLIPVPDSITTNLSGHNILTNIDNITGIGHIWRPFSMSPETTLNALFSLSIPLGVVLLCIQLNREEIFLLLPILIFFGLLSGCWGLLQAMGESGGLLYLYRITNDGSAVGLFANRNHQAVMLASLFPMLTVYSSVGIKTVEQFKRKTIVALSVGVVLIPLLLVTGSRAGLVVGLLALLSIGLLYRKPRIDVPHKRMKRKFDPIYVAGAFGVALVAAITILMSRAQSFDRILLGTQSDDIRWKIWQPVFEAAGQYFPFGSGAGSFVPVYQIHEPLSLLGLYYRNQAHNDVLDLYLASGLLGFLLLVAFLAIVARSTINAFRQKLDGRREIVFRRLGAIIIAIYGISSMADYPLRAPASVVLFSIALIWLCKNYTEQPNNAGSV